MAVRALHCCPVYFLDDTTVRCDMKPIMAKQVKKLSPASVVKLQWIIIALFMFLLWAMMLNKSAYSVRLEERVAELKQVIHKSDAACLSAENYYQRHHRRGRL
jgi:hypothetical protein